jgi:hypothetical protein
VSAFSLPWYLPERGAVKFIKKLLEDKDVEAVLQRLDRLTQDEIRNTAAETLKVIYGLFQNIGAIIEGEQTHSGCNASFVTDSSF